MSVDKRLLSRESFFIAGQWAAPASTARCPVVSPSSETEIGEVPAATAVDIDRAVAAARGAFERGAWPRMTAGERAGLLARAAEQLRRRASEIAGVAVEEMGVAISQAARSQTGLVAP